MTDRKKIRNDIILIASLSIAVIIALVVVLLTRVKTNLVAKVAVQNNVVLTIDLSKNEEADYYVNGLNGQLRIHTHNVAICVLESNCPHQDCVHVGYVNTTNRPIICAYNAVYIYLEGAATSSEVVI